MPENPQATSDPAPITKTQEPSSIAQASFDRDAFVAEYTKREKEAIAKAVAPLHKEIKRLNTISTLKDLPAEEREILSERGNFNIEAAEMVKDRFNLADELIDDILAKGSYAEMVKYGERMARVIGVSKKEANSIAQELINKKPENVSEIQKGAATETVMSGSTASNFNSVTPATKDNIDKLWLDAEERGGHNPYAEQYRKFMRTGSL